MLRRPAKLKLFYLIGLATLWLWPGPAYAQMDEPVGLSVVPAIIDQPLTPGISTTISIQVTNITDQPLAVKIGTRPLAPLDPLVDESIRARYDASLWLAPLTPDLVLAPNQTRAVQLTAIADEAAGPGGHYALVIFRVLTDQAPAEASSARVNPEVASVVMFSLPGDTTEQLELSLNQPPIWQTWRPEHISFNLINRGNTHVLPTTTVAASSILIGEDQNVDATAHLVLPGTSSQFKATWPQLEWGLYQLELNVNYGTPLKNLSTSSRWFVVPPPFWIQALAAVGFWLVAKGIRRGLSRLGPIRHRRRRVGSDSSGLDRPGVAADELDYLSREPSVSDVSRRKRRG